MDEVIIVSNKHELLSFGYVYDNVGKEVIYNDVSFLLKRHGIREIRQFHLPFMGYNTAILPQIVPRNPIWIMAVGDIELTITDIN